MIRSSDRGGEWNSFEEAVPWKETTKQFLKPCCNCFKKTNVHRRPVLFSNSATPSSNKDMLQKLFFWNSFSETVSNKKRAVLFCYTKRTETPTPNSRRCKLHIMRPCLRRGKWSRWWERTPVLAAIEHYWRISSRCTRPCGCELGIQRILPVPPLH